MRTSDLALFDFDGTITKSYTWAPFLRTTVPPVRFAVGRALLLPVGIGYRLRWLSGARARQIATWIALRGLNAATVKAHGVDYARQALPQEIRPELLNGDCSGPEKAKRIRATLDLSMYRTVYAYGDSLEDREMLECATEKYYRPWEPTGSPSRKQW